MMKSFFKKLAFVMALAMVVTMAAPAAQKAVAADKDLAVTYQNENHYSINEVNLANVGDKEDLKFLWAPSNWKELGVKWTSSNENVVTVDPNGVVTAVAAGTADVSVAVGTQTATVAVNVEELPAYTVSIGLGDERSVTEKELEVGESVDFAFYGIKDYSRDKVGALPRYLCTWQSDDTTVLSKDNEAGLFTAVKAGTAKVTLTVANVLTGQTHNVIPVAVTVKAPVVESNDVVIVTGRNKTQNTVEVELPKAATLGLADIEIFRVYFADNDENGDGVIDDRDIDKPYESVYVNKFNGSAKNYVAETFDDFIDGVTYEVQVKGFEPVRFVASVGDVAEVVVLEKDGASLETEDTALDPAHVKVVLYDANKVDVTTRKIDGIANNDASNVTFWLVDDTAAEYAMTDYDEIEFYELATASVMATYDNNGKAVDSVDPCLITPQKANEYAIKRVVSWSLVDPADGKVKDWTKPVHDVPAGEYGYVIATLLEDTRGNFFTTHEPSTATKYNGQPVYYTEDEDKAFWIHGFRAEYRAQDPDKMLVEDYGDVASYKEGRARYALYLYNQFNSTDAEFVKELYSQYVNVCHPKQMTNMTATTAVKILTNTEYDENNPNGLAVDESNAYYSLFSKQNLEVVLWDIHGKEAKAPEHAGEADFEIQLITGKTAKESQAQYEALKDLIENKYANELNYGVKELTGNESRLSTNKRSIVVEANDFKAIDCTKGQVKFKITEAVTKKTVTVTITLTKPVVELDPNTTYKQKVDDQGNLVFDDAGEPVMVVDVPSYSAKVATIDEYFDKLGIKLPFEKFVTSTNGFTVEQKVANALANKRTDFYTVLLKQVDKGGNEIGIDNNIFVANTLDVKTTADVVPNPNQQPLSEGDRILIIKGPDGKIYPSNNGVYGEYKNPAFTTKVPDGYGMTETTSALGVSVDPKAAYATSASGNAVAVNQYKFVFRTVDNNDEIIYAKNGRYSVTIKTVKQIGVDVNNNNVIDANEADLIAFTKSTGLTDSFTITVANSNAQVEYAGRDLTRVEGAVNGYDWANGLNNVTGGTVNAEYGDDPEVKELILKAFNFKFTSGAAWDEAWNNGVLEDGTYKLSAEDILYYTYTLTPTNKQVVINKVVFAVPSDATGEKQ
ncbi:MAG: Ig-like domain-containing protein, partial [Lachnospiraceae bacterium]|nr:Ig-like domain-containing protein [Lachnospiraceae bacterium]